MTRNFYQSQAWLTIRRKALIRDGHRCVMCGIDVSGYKKSRVDHIYTVKSRPDLALSLSNLRTLCGVCDNRRHADKLGNKPKDIIAVGVDGWPITDGVDGINGGQGGMK
jgi:5-methylcytosine-specific restriction endonuclease McrA